MKIRAAEIVLGYRFEGHDVIGINRGVGVLFVTTTADVAHPFTFTNEQRIEVNDR